MQVIVEPAGDVAVVVLVADQLDAANADQFRRDMDPVLQANKKVVLDLDQVRFVDSRGCGVILECLKALSGHRGALRLCNVRGDVRTVFDLIRLTRVCPVDGTREQSLAAFAP